LGGVEQLKCFILIGEYMQKALVIDVQGSLRSGRLIEVLTQFISVRGAQICLFSDTPRAREQCRPPVAERDRD